MTAAFVAVFAVFVLLILGLAVVAVRWGVRRDRAVRAGRSQPPAPAAGEPGGAPPDPDPRRGARR